MEMDAVKVNWAKYFQKTEEGNNAIVSLWVNSVLYRWGQTRNAPDNKKKAPVL